jgi:tRNA(Arg) A34 adenosine deaminase TadA
VAALATHGSEIAAIAGSRVDTSGNPRAHAEMTVIGKPADGSAARVLLYSTMEPCPMCARAIHLAEIGTVVL